MAWARFPDSNLDQVKGGQGTKLILISNLLIVCTHSNMFSFNRLIEAMWEGTAPCTHGPQ